ncbi:MAG: BolA/IbaG family iron-sulfur metabolism protein [Pseudomonadota bacterium]|nr:BolA/IbaG family iron-sulfur metabolism protein [Pseudomonadota bacterium]MEC9458403.1 BolA/IbaG family iron-sulfur metabolism protein [Pseudomonadota bacterium]MEC9481583.1 BolA/IbaG family iron-sulfur metabolism protein [Pseudomonadota bacterium]
MTIKKEELENMITKAFPEAKVEIIDLAGDDNHYSLIITSNRFSGISRIDQHKMVYEALDGKMGNELHALTIKTLVS